MNLSRLAVFVITAIFGCFSLLSAQDTTVSEEFSKTAYLKQFTGFYISESGKEGEISLNEEGALMVQPPGAGMKMMMVPTAKDEFDMKGEQRVHFKFKRNDEGLIISTELTQPSGAKIELKRKMD